MTHETASENGEKWHQENYFLNVTGIDIFLVQVITLIFYHIRVANRFLNNLSTAPRFAAATPGLPSALEPISQEPLLILGA